VVIDAVFFDGDQTLWDFETLMRRALAHALGELRRLRPCPATERLDVDSLIADRAAVVDQLSEPFVVHGDVRRAAFLRTLDRIGLPDAALANHLTDCYLAQRFTDVPLYPDALPSLASLAEHHRLGLLSNGNGYPEQCGLTGIFDVVVLAQDHGVAKPDRRIYDIAAKEIGRPANRIAMVGDSFPNDVLGAKEAGWEGIWLVRGDNRAAAQPWPYVVTGLQQIADMLTSIA